MRTLIIEHNQPTRPEGYDKGAKIIRTLKTLANTGSNKHKVYLTESRYGIEDKEFKGLVLSIAETPGSWYIKTLAESPHCALDYDKMPIYGNDWKCLNWQEIVTELKTIITNL